MTEIADGDSTEGQPPEGAPPGAPAETLPASVEEANAIWQKRLSGKDRAHHAEVTELRRQLEAARTGQPPAASAGQGETPEQARIKELEQRLQQTEREKAIAIRKARFPNAAEDLGDDIATVDEARLARLEARLAEEAGPPPRMDPNSAARGTLGAPPKTLDEMSVQELKDALKGLSPAYEEYLRSIR